MAQGMKPKVGSAAGARRELGDRARPRPAAALSAYGGIEACRLVVLAKPLPSGAGYYEPFAVVRFEDLPEELRRQIAGASASASGHGAVARPRDPNAAPVAAPLRCEGVGARYHAALRIDVVPEDGQGHRRQLPGLVFGPSDEATVKFAGDGNSGAVKDYSERRVLRLMEEGDMEGSLFQKEKGFSHAWMEQSGDDEVWACGPKYKVVANDKSEPSNMAAEHSSTHAHMGAGYDNSLLTREIAGTPALDCSDGLAFPREDAVPFVETLVGNGRATEQGIYCYVVLLPPENVMAAAEALPARRPPTYAVQVWVDDAAGGKAGDPVAVGVKAAGADAGHEQHGSNLSAVLGIVVASSAATALAAGIVGPATAFGLFAALVGGLSLAMASVRAP